MSDDPVKGLGAAVDAIGAGDLPDGEDAGEQGELLPLPLTPAQETPAAQAGRRGPGRPPGSANRSTKDWADYILARYSSPLIFLAETYSRPVDELALELGCTREAAFKLQQAAAERLAPYIHQKMPVAIEADTRSAGVLLILAPGDPRAERLAAEMGVDLPFRSEPRKTAENSQKIEHKSGQSHDKKSHDKATG